MKKLKSNIGFYLFVFSSLTFFLAIYFSTILKILKIPDLNIVIDRKFMLLTSILGSISIIAITIINFYFLSFLSYKIMNIKSRENVLYRKFKYVYSLILIPISIEKLLCSIFTISSKNVISSLSLYQIIKSNNNIINFFIKIINPFNILFLILTLYGMSLLYKNKDKLFFIKVIIISLIFILLKADWLTLFFV